MNKRTAFRLFRYHIDPALDFDVSSVRRVLYDKRVGNCRSVIADVNTRDAGPTRVLLELCRSRSRPTERGLPDSDWERVHGGAVAQRHRTKQGDLWRKISITPYSKP